MKFMRQEVKKQPLGLPNRAPSYAMTLTGRVIRAISSIEYREFPHAHSPPIESEGFPWAQGRPGKNATATAGKHPLPLIWIILVAMEKYPKTYGSTLDQT